MMFSELGSMSVGHSASRKFGGPEMYNVAIRLFHAGEAKGKRRVKARWSVDGWEEVCSCLCAARAWSVGHCYENC